LKKTDEEGDGRCPYDEEGHPPNGLELRPPERPREEEESDHQKSQGERIDEQGDPAPQWAAPLTSSDSEDSDPGQTEHAQPQENDALDNQGRLRISDHLEQGRGFNTAEHHPDECESDTEDIGRRYCRPLQRPLQATTGKGQGQVDKEDWRNKIECLSNGVKENGVRPGEEG
jgi:hypothetical protein